MKKYIIVTPSYSKSSGVRMLHKLADALIAEGFSVSLFSYAPYLDKYQYVSKITEDMRKNDVVIYPEVVKGNPLLFQNVARWVLYFPGKLGGESTYHHSEYVFTWSKKYYPHALEINFSTIDTTLFYNDGSVKKHNAYFVYKGGQGRIIPEIKNAIRIDMNFPSDREDLGKILRETNILYSYDHNTAIIDEALACGARAIIITDTDLIECKVSDAKAYTPRENILEFIRITQNMNYTGNIQKSPSCYPVHLLQKLRLFIARIRKNSKRIYKYSLRY